MVMIVKQASVDSEFRRRRRISRANRKLRDRRENSMRRDLRRFWTSMERIILERVQKIGKTGFIIEEIFRPSEFSQPFARVVLPQFTRSVFAGIAFEAEYIRTLQPPRQGLLGDFVIKQVKRDPLDEIEPEDIELPPSINVELTPRMRRQVSSLLKQRSVGVWRKVGPSLRDSMERTILKSLEDGDPFEVLTKRLREKLKKIKNVQPAAIARTETTFLMNKGGQIEREELQIPSKEWVSTIDARNRGADPKSRFDHLSPDGQIVANGQPFEVSGEFLMNPADGSLGASAGNIIQCRCASIASLKDSTRRGVRRSIEPELPTVVEKPVKLADIKLTEEEDRSVTAWIGGAATDIRIAEAAGRIDKNIKLFHGALDKFQQHKGLVFRGMTVDEFGLKEFANLKKGSTITYKASSSASKLRKVSKRFAEPGIFSSGRNKKVMFNIKTKTGADISVKAKEQAEVILRRGTKYEIDKVQVNSGGMDLVIHMKEVTG